MVSTSHGEGASEASARAATGNGGERAERILRAAIRLFIREGGAGFSARGVAKEAGVSLGAVQHFFRTRDQLLTAMLERILADYAENYEKVAAEFPFNGEARLLKAIEFLVSDAWRPDTRKFFFNLYALSCNNAFAAKRMNELFAHHRRRLAGYVGAARPHLSEEECFDIALQIAALLEGLLMYTAPGAKSVSSRERMTEIVKDAVLRLISVPTSASRK
jgi:AcrR family transcriptional regulator